MCVGGGIGLKLRESRFLAFGRFLQDEAVNHFGLQALQSLLPRFNSTCIKVAIGNANAIVHSCVTFSRAHMLHFCSQQCHKNFFRCRILVNSRAVISVTRALGRAAVKIILQEIISSPSPFLQGGLSVSCLFSRIVLSSTCKLRLFYSHFSRSARCTEAWSPQVSHGAK